MTYTVDENRALPPRSHMTSGTSANTARSQVPKVMNYNRVTFSGIRSVG